MDVNEKVKVTFETPRYVGLKINGQPLTIDVTKCHESWLAWGLVYGLHRGPNDANSALKGNDKFDAVRTFIASMKDEKPERVVTSRKAVDPIEEEALKLAREWLKEIFIAKDFGTKIAEWNGHKVAGKYFNENGVWITDKLREFITANKAKRDIMAEAKRNVEKRSAAAEDIDL